MAKAHESQALLAEAGWSAALPAGASKDDRICRTLTGRGDRFRSTRVELQSQDVCHLLLGDSLEEGAEQRR